MNINFLNPISVKKPFLLNKTNKENSSLLYSKNLKCDTVCFTCNKKQNVDKDVFFIDMDFYQKNSKWGKSMVKLLNDVTDMIDDKKGFDEIVEKTAKNINEFYKTLLVDQLYCENGKENPDYDTYVYMLKHFADSYGRLKNMSSSTYFSIILDERGQEYYETYKKECLKSPNNKYKTHSNYEYKDAKTTEISFPRTGEIRVYYAGGATECKKNLEVAKRAYEKLIGTENPTLNEVVETAATIQWLIAQATPFESGSDSIANVIAKAILQAYDVKLSPIKSGKSFDFEAFYQDLDDYIQIYPKLFREKLEFVK